MWIDESGDLHEKNINPREHGILMIIEQGKGQKYGLHFYGAVFICFKCLFDFVIPETRWASGYFIVNREVDR